MVLAGRLSDLAGTIGWAAAGNGTEGGRGGGGAAPLEAGGSCARLIRRLPGAGAGGAGGARSGGGTGMGRAVGILAAAGGTAPRALEISVLAWAVVSEPQAGQATGAGKRAGVGSTADFDFGAPGE